MIFVTQGTPVFGGSVHRAKLIFDCNDTDSLDQCVLYSETLTNEIAIKVIENGLRGLITNESSFATHGANIIRGYCHKTGMRITWVSGVPKSEIDCFKNKIVDICDGCISCSEYGDNRADLTENVRIQMKFMPQSPRCLVRYNISDGNCSVCYWPHRSYDPFTFSIMASGLKLNYTSYFDRDVKITRDEAGHIWFENGFFLRDLTKKAYDPENGNAFLEQQMACYNEICCTLSHGDVSPEGILQLLVKYFSVFLLFHNTYEQVFQKAYHDLQTVIPKQIAYEFLDFLMFCEIDEWMLNIGYPLEKNKNLFSAEPITPVPDLCIYVDAAHKQQAVREWFAQQHLLGRYFENRKQIEYWVRVFVVKEWKFIINKLLFTRMSAIMREFSQDVVCKTKQQPYSQWLEKN